MNRKPIYLDYMATTPVDPRVNTQMEPYFQEYFGNPASQHFYGYQAKSAITKAREQVATLLHCDPQAIIWTSGATESNNLALKGAATFYQRQGKHIITAKTEHKSVLDSCKYLETQGFEVTYLTPQTDGLIDLTQLKQALRPDTILVSIMQVNNEIGTIQDIAAIGELTAARGVLLHVDATQGVGKIPLNLHQTKIDLLACSAHKLYGPKGVGALYVRPHPRLHLTPQIHGGHHEYGLRSGTLATPQIVGMGAACQLAAQEMVTENQHILALRTQLWDGIKDLGGISLNGSATKRIAGNLNLSFADIDGELLLAALTDIAVSAAAACTKAHFEPSHVLSAIGVPIQLALNTIRISLGRFTTKREIAHTITHIREVVTKLRASNS